MAARGTFQAALSGLRDNAHYYFRAGAIGDSTVYGAEQSFVTRREPSAITQHPRSSPAPPQQTPPYMTIQYLSINPIQASIGQPVTIVTNIVNTGDETGGYTAVLKINGEIEQSRTFNVGPKATQPVKFTVTRTQPGTYAVDIGNQKANFTIIDAGSRSVIGTGASILFVVSIAVIAALVLLLIVVSRRRFQDY